MRLLVVVVDRISPDLKWEPAGDDLYPHVYGPLNMDAVAKMVPVAKNPTGRFEIQPDYLSSKFTDADAIL